MYQHFIEALNKKYNCTGQTDLTGMDLQHYMFASTSNQRGQDTLHDFEAYGFSLQGLKILDVGCAYGGFSIEAAKKGAICYGVEISETLYHFAMLNHKDEIYESGSCKFVFCDVLSTDFLEKIPTDFFDLVIVNDVFEHIYDTVQLLSNLSKAANKNGAIYFVIPNGHDVKFVAKEGHTGYCGISIIDPLLWFTLTGERRLSIYYHQFEYYKALFTYFGFSNINLINYSSWASKNQLEHIDAQFETTKRTILDQLQLLPDKYSSKLSAEFTKYEKQFHADKKILSAQEFCWKYDVRFWCGFAHRAPKPVGRLTSTSERRHTSDFNEKYDVLFTLSLEHQTLVIDVDCGKGTDLDFSFYLMTARGKLIKKGHWQSSPHCEWELAGAGMYSVAIYIKAKNFEKHEYCIKTAPLYYAGGKENHL